MSNQIRVRMVLVAIALFAVSIPSVSYSQDLEMIEGIVVDEATGRTFMVHFEEIPCDTDEDGIAQNDDADFNNDGSVDVFDLKIFRDDLDVGADGGTGTDVNCDGVVDTFDWPRVFELYRAG